MTSGAKKGVKSGEIRVQLLQNISVPGLHTGSVEEYCTIRIAAVLLPIVPEIFVCLLRK